MSALKLIKTGKNCKLYQQINANGSEGPKLILLERVRLSFPAIGHMKEDENEDGSTKKAYKAVPMLLKDTHVEAKDMFVQVMNELMTANKVKIPPEYRCIKNGDDSEREEYQNHWTISCSETRRPPARDETGRLYLDPAKVKDGDQVEAILNNIDEIFHGGVIATVLVRPWYFDGKVKGKTKTYPKRICCGLTGIQFVEDDGTSYGQGRIDDSAVWGSADGDDLNGGSTDLDDDPDGL